MQAVILAGGRGTRMGDLTKDTPKPLLTVHGKTLLEHKFDALPENINEVILVVGYKGELIKDKLGFFYKNKKIVYIDALEPLGTAHALWQAKEILKDRFIVMMGDDIYDPKSLEECSNYNYSIVCKIPSSEEDGGRIVLDENGRLIDFVTANLYKRTHQNDGLIFTGLYSLTPKIFEYPMVKLETKDEWGLPQTLLGLAKNEDIKIIKTDFWISISNPEDLKKAAEIIKGVIIKV